MLAARDKTSSYDREPGYKIEMCFGAAQDLQPPLNRLGRLEQYERGSEEDRFFDREARLNRERYRSICSEQAERDRLKQVERDRLQQVERDRLQQVERRLDQIEWDRVRQSGEGPYKNFYQESNMPIRKYQRRF